PRKRGHRCPRRRCFAHGAPRAAGATTLTSELALLPRLQDGADQVFRSAGRGGSLGVLKGMLSPNDGLLVGLDVVDAGVADSQVPLELRGAIGRQLPLQVQVEEVDQLAACDVRPSFHQSVVLHLGLIVICTDPALSHSMPDLPKGFSPTCDTC